MYVLADSEKDDRKPKVTQRILDRMRICLRPYLSPKYPPIMLPIISPKKIVYVINISSDLVILRSFFIIGTMIDMIIISIPSKQDNIIEQVTIIQ